MGGYDLPPDTPGFADAQARMSARSRAAVDLPDARFNLAYGSDKRHRLDVFPAGPGAPAFLFLRGGYWKVGEKEDRWFPALEWLPRGVSWIVPNYRLAPDVSLVEIVEDAGAAFEWVLANGTDHGIDTALIHLVGNSAGAHLGAMVAAGRNLPQVRSLTLISGLFDLTDLLGEGPNAWLGLTRETAQAMSPAFHLPAADLPITVTCGGAESDAFRAQSRYFAEALTTNGNPVSYFESPGKHHMNIIEELGTPGTPLFDAMEQSARANSKGQ